MKTMLGYLKAARFRPGGARVGPMRPAAAHRDERPAQSGGLRQGFSDDFAGLWKNAAVYPAGGGLPGAGQLAFHSGGGELLRRPAPGGVQAGQAHGF